MANAKISELTELTTPETADVFAIVDDSTSTTKKLSWASLRATLKTYFDALYAAALGPDENYVTDAQLMVIQNTSGTNTGDNAVNSLYSGLADSKVPYTGATGDLNMGSYNINVSNVRVYTNGSSVYYSDSGSTVLGSINFSADSLLGLAQGTKLANIDFSSITGTKNYTLPNTSGTLALTSDLTSLAVLPASGTIDDTNTSFTFSSTPLVVVVNGLTYRNGAGVTISGTSVTTDSPVGTNGDIYALG